jgi:hypothetical protein
MGDVKGENFLTKKFTLRLSPYALFFDFLISLLDSQILAGVRFTLDTQQITVITIRL